MRKREPPKRGIQQHLLEKKPKLGDNPESQQIHEILEGNFVEQGEVQRSNDKSTQTDEKKHELSSRTENVILRNELLTLTSAPKFLSNLLYEVFVNNPKEMKHFTNLTPSQFEILYEFLNDVCPLETLSSPTKRRSD